MTVAELINRLQQLPADLPVYVGDWNEGYAPDCPLDGASGPTVLPPRTVTRRGIEILSLSLPERVVIGESSF